MNLDEIEPTYSADEIKESIQKVQYLQEKPIDENLRAGADCGLGGADNCDDEPEESYFERLMGLTEMFPAPVRNFLGTVTECSVCAAKNLYAFSCNASWVFFTSSMILFAPVIFETERAQMEELQKSQQKQVLLGPGSAISGGSPMPPMTSRS